MFEILNALIRLGWWGTSAARSDRLLMMQS
jgi:hypothetical protein